MTADRHIERINSRNKSDITIDGKLHKAGTLLCTSTSQNIGEVFNYTYRGFSQDWSREDIESLYPNLTEWN